MRKRPGSVYDKWNIPVVICDIDIPEQSTKSWWRCNIPAPPAYGVYISQLIRYSRACGFYQDFKGSY
jgi:hypothetical protein